jgi:hypothetical protein
MLRMPRCPLRQERTVVMRRPIAAGVLVITATATSIVVANGKPDWLTLTADVRQGWDSNVFLQNVGDLRRRESPVTTAELNAALNYTRPGSDDRTSLTGLVSYAPSYSEFWNESSESHWKHVFQGDLTALEGRGLFKMTNKLTLIDGDDTSPTYLGQGGAPALGGISVRDRRDAAIITHKSSFKWQDGDWFARPVVSFYHHDFQTKQSQAPGYQNYVDRGELNAGLDLGYTVAPKTLAFLGYRYGHQYESNLFDSDIDYSNAYHRFIVGIEGTPSKQLTLNVQGGIDWRLFESHVSPLTKPNQFVPYVDASVKWMPSDIDTVTLTVTSYMQPGFAGRSVYQDSIYTLAYAHKWSKQWTMTLSERAWNGDFVSPAVRDDWIYTTTLAAEWSDGHRFTLGATATYEWSHSNVDDTPSREFDRVYVGVFGKLAM